MSFHVIGITHDHKMQQLCSSASKEYALERALQYAAPYLQLFLVQPDFNIRELHYQPPEAPSGTLLLGKFQPEIR